MFIDWLTDEHGREYEYGHCYCDSDDGNEFGCGMEYAWHAATETLESWHDAVGLVTTREGFTRTHRDELEAEHSTHETWEREQ